MPLFFVKRRLRYPYPVVSCSQLTLQTSADYSVAAPMGVNQCYVQSPTGPIGDREIDAVQQQMGSFEPRARI